MSLYDHLKIVNLYKKNDQIKRLVYQSLYEEEKLSFWNEKLYVLCFEKMEIGDDHFFRDQHEWLLTIPIDFYHTIDQMCRFAYLDHEKVILDHDTTIAYLIANLSDQIKFYISEPTKDRLIKFTNKLSPKIIDFLFENNRHYSIDYTFSILWFRVCTFHEDLSPRYSMQISIHKIFIRCPNIFNVIE